VAQARLKLTTKAFDVVVVDMRFRSAADEFAERGVVSTSRSLRTPAS
jgi:hypothetical protein